jgi:Rrf2 family transcriptional regulator, cysteine metabolism repressor
VTLRGMSLRKFFALQISREAEYALRAVLDLSVNSGEEFVKISLIATRQQIPHGFLEAIMAKLRQDGLVNTRRGYDGGCRLARAPDQITIGDILASVARNAYSNRVSQHPFDAVWLDVDQSISAIIDRITFAELAERSREPSDQLAPS